jgi:hypothetical protein
MRFRLIQVSLYIEFRTVDKVQTLVRTLQILLAECRFSISLATHDPYEVPRMQFAERAKR